ncbi:hypothetical protein [Dyadobacter crusticola]|uniref:hypothetical protein n=1 Tax=Dyadobacter crusticola TaxID=292407 RepID=UPI0004E22CA7|nr:hypothetical protein [Dyadobacter crusticola]
MSDIEKTIKPRFTSEELIQNFVDAEYDPAEMEQLFTDMMLRYIYPTKDWNPGPRVTRDVLDRGEIFLDLLRGIRCRL